MRNGHHILDIGELRNDLEDLGKLVGLGDNGNVGNGGWIKLLGLVARPSEKANGKEAGIAWDVVANCDGIVCVG